MSVQASYTKLREGDWGVRVVSDGAAISPGDIVQVTTKAGKSKQETVDKVIWSGPDREDPSRRVFLCLPKRESKSNGGHPPGSQGEVWEECSRCGQEPIYLPRMLCSGCW